MVGTGFYSSKLDAFKNFDGMIFGNGEHYLYNFATNVYWLRFLDLTNYLPRKTLEAAIDGVNVGEQLEIITSIQNVIIIYQIPYSRTTASLLLRSERRRLCPSKEETTIRRNLHSHDIGTFISCHQTRVGQTSVHRC